MSDQTLSNLLTAPEKVGIINYVACRSGGMADAHGSGPCVGNNMRVQVPSPALELSGAMVKFISPFGAHICGSVGIGRRARLRIL